MDNSKFISKKDHEKALAHCIKQMQDYEQECSRHMEKGFEEAYKSLQEERKRSHKENAKFVDLACRMQKLMQDKADSDSRYESELSFMAHELFIAANIVGTGPTGMPIMGGVGALTKKSNDYGKMKASSLNGGYVGKAKRMEMANEGHCSDSDPVMAEDSVEHESIYDECCSGSDPVMAENSVQRDSISAAKAQMSYAKSQTARDKSCSWYSGEDCYKDDEDTSRPKDMDESVARSIEEAGHKCQERDVDL